MKQTFKQFLEGSVVSMEKFLQRKNKQNEDEVSALLDKSDDLVDHNMGGHAHDVSELAHKKYEANEKYRKKQKEIMAQSKKGKN